MTVDASRILTDFVCIPRLIERAATPDGGPLRYRVRHEIKLWQPGEAPQLLQSVVEGNAALGANLSDRTKFTNTLRQPPQWQPA